VAYFRLYAHADDELQAEFETVFSSLIRQGLALAWTDTRICPGSEWKDSLFSARELRSDKRVVVICAEDWEAWARQNGAIGCSSHATNLLAGDTR